MARPKKISTEVLQKLEDGFVMGMTDREACIYADISTGTLYNYCNAKPEFLERKEQLKDGVKMRAKINVAKKIEGGDVDLSLWYLERKSKDEFSAKQEIGVSGSMDVRKIYDGMSEEELVELARKYEKINSS